MLTGGEIWKKQIAKLGYDEQKYDNRSLQLDHMDRIIQYFDERVCNDKSGVTKGLRKMDTKISNEEVCAADNEAILRVKDSN
ncbi:TPA: hypothetical protein ACX6RS_001129 [Photobacterium damselae]